MLDDIKIRNEINRRQALFGFAATVISVGCSTSSKRKKIEDDHELDAPPPQLEAGVAYIYNHIGPRPFSEGKQDCTGERVVSVLGRDPEFQNLWVVQDRFECEEGIEIGLYDDKYRRHRQGLKSDAGVIQVEEEPPVEIRWLDMKKKDKKTFETEQSFLTIDGEIVGAAQMVENVEREYDYRIVNSVGAILCRYFKTNVVIEANLNGEFLKVEAAVETYWSDKLHWFVQAEYDFKPMKRGGEVVGPAYRAKSVLKDIQEAEA
ncbi:hypothetical protein K8I31_08580 [bacterium]|nr:hypothetical protein [bacterium]